MRIALAQIQSEKGAIEANIKKHLHWIEAAVQNQSDLIIFPELSITNYESELAQALAFEIDDPRLAVFQQLSDEKQIKIAVSLPLKTASKPHISLLIFHPKQELRVYSKQYLHEDELPYFTAGKKVPFLLDHGIALAICYEVKVPEHIQAALDNGAKLYLSSVAKPDRTMEAAYAQLSQLAKTRQIPVLMSNAIGPGDNFISGGKSAAWDAEGNLVGALSADEEGILYFDFEVGD